MRISGGGRAAYDWDASGGMLRAGYAIRCWRDDHCAGELATGSEGKKVDLLKSSSSTSDSDVFD